VAVGIAATFSEVLKDTNDPFATSSRLNPRKRFEPDASSPVLANPIRQPHSTWCQPGLGTEPSVEALP
jgi:hypothetical protein